MNKNNTNAVPLNTTTFNTRLLNTTKLNTNGFPVLSKRSGSSADISQAIMDSLVCWYDPGKQQCTNESMAANPVLADLSGNGHDITCYNFGWSGMSGIGGYIHDSSNLNNTSYSKISDNIITIINNEGATNETQIVASKSIIGKKGETLTYTIKAFDIKASNLPDGMYFQVNAAKNNGNTIEWVMIEENCLNGITHIDERTYTIEPYDSESTPSLIDFRIIFTRELASVENIADLGITIEILPLYPNALVSDGVDDYCYTDGLPILTDYTVIAKRKILADNISADNNACIAFKGKDGIEHAFIFERLGSNGNFMEYNFGSYNSITIHSDEITYCTKSSYNGQSIIAGTSVDTDGLRLYSTASGAAKLKAALYSFLLFDRTLTTAEIEWVKQNMIESGGVLATNWSDSSLWAFRDGIHTVYDKRVEGTLSSNIMVITSCITTNNFMEVVIENTQTPAYNIKVTGLKNGITLQYKDAYTATYLYFNEDGIYTIPAHNTNGRWYGFSFNKTFENENIVIQQLLS